MCLIQVVLSLFYCFYEWLVLNLFPPVNTISALYSVRVTVGSAVCLGGSFVGYIGWFTMSEIVGVGEGLLLVGL